MMRAKIAQKIDPAGWERAEDYRERAVQLETSGAPAHHELAAHYRRGADAAQAALLANADEILAILHEPTQAMIDAYNQHGAPFVQSGYSALLKAASSERG